MISILNHHVINIGRILDWIFPSCFELFVTNLQALSGSKLVNDSLRQEYSPKCLVTLTDLFRANDHLYVLF